MGSFEPFSEDDLEISLDALASIGAIALRYIQENSTDRIDAEGNPLPVSKGKRGKAKGNVDLYETGNMLYQDVSFDFDARSMTVVVSFNAEYAADVEERYHWAGIPPQKWDAFVDEITPYFVDGLSLASYGGARAGGGGLGAGLDDLPF